MDNSRLFDLFNLTFFVVANKIYAGLSMKFTIRQTQVKNKQTIFVQMFGWNVSANKGSEGSKLTKVYEWVWKDNEFMNDGRQMET